MTQTSSFLVRWRLLLAVVIGVFVGSGCDAPGTSMPLDNTPCACTVGAKRCNGDQIQVCEATTPTCPSWGAATACPGGACSNNACAVTCTDMCPGGTTRCTSETGMDVCRIGASGCLEWVPQACTAAQYCGGNICQPAIACEPSCPSGYTCKPTGVCAGGSPTGLNLDVKTVTVSGKVTLNGATPSIGASCAGNPNINTSVIEFTEKTSKYVFYLGTYCKDNTYSYSGSVYPGTYSVRVNNPNGSGVGNIPMASSNSISFVANNALALTANATGVDLNVNTVSVSGKVTLNGATPTIGVNCAGNPNLNTAVIELTEKTAGYVFYLGTYCKDNTYSYSGSVYPGTYSVRVNNPNGSGISNIPTASSNSISFVANNALPLTANTAGVNLNVNTVSISGKVTLNGATPTIGVNCAGNPNINTAVIELTEKTAGYVFYLGTYCKDNTYSYSGSVYPGTYSVRVNNPNGSGVGNIPMASSNSISFVANNALALTANATGVDLNVNTVSVSGKVTLNGATPTIGVNCAGNPNLNTAVIELTEKTAGYVFYLGTYCKDNTYSYSGSVYPGTYSVRVNNPNGSGISNIPTASSNSISFVANNALPLTANTAGVNLNVNTVSISGKVTLNGATPTIGVNCAGNPNINTAVIELTEKTAGYVFYLGTYCKDKTYSYSGSVYPGTYSVRVNNPSGSGYGNIPTAFRDSNSFVANSSLSLTANTAGADLNVSTVAVSGKVTLNSTTPTIGTNCAGNPNINTAVIEFSEKKLGYVLYLGTYCKDNMYSYSGSLYPGTYSVRVNNPNGNGYSNIPSASSNSQSFIAVSQILIP